MITNIRRFWILKQIICFLCFCCCSPLFVSTHSKWEISSKLRCFVITLYRCIGINCDFFFLFSQRNNRNESKEQRQPIINNIFCLSIHPMRTKKKRKTRNLLPKLWTFSLSFLFLLLMEQYMNIKYQTSRIASFRSHL